MITPFIFLGKRCYLCYEECSNQDTSLIAQTVPHLGIDIGVENPKNFMIVETNMNGYGLNLLI